MPRTSNRNRRGQSSQRHSPAVSNGSDREFGSIRLGPPTQHKHTHPRASQRRGAHDSPRRVLPSDDEEAVEAVEDVVQVEYEPELARERRPRRAATRRESPALPSPAPGRRSRRAAAQTATQRMREAESEEDEEEEEETPVPSGGHVCGRRCRVYVEIPPYVAEDDVEHEEVPEVPAPVDEEEEEEEEEEEVVVVVDSTPEKGKSRAVQVEAPSTSNRRARERSDESEDQLPTKRTRVEKDQGKGKGKAKSRAGESSGSQTADRKERRAREEKNRRRDDDRRKQHKRDRDRRGHSRHHDPDDSDDPDALTEDEDVAAEIALDEPGRFKTKSRLRGAKKNTFLDGLKKLRGRRAAQQWPPKEGESSESESESDEEDWESEEDSVDGRAPGSDDWIIDESDDASSVALPQEFSLKRESPEFKFKVVFQYIVLLVVRGAHGVFPLRGEKKEYFGRQLHDVRERMRGLRDTIASPLWRPDLREALETYPIWKQSRLDESESFCEACNRRNQMCTQEAWLRGDPYDAETHEDDDEDDPEMVLDEEDDARDLGPMGSFCLRRTRSFHETHHWEHTIFLFVRRRYHCLRRAASSMNARVRGPSFDSLKSNSTDSEGEVADRRMARKESRKFVVEILNAGPLPDPYDPDAVTEWMDKRGWQRQAMQMIARIEQRARDLERND